MRSISKAHQQNIDRAVNACAATAKQLQHAIEEYNGALASHRAKIETALEAYNETLSDFRSVYTDIAGEARDYYGGRSERWQKSKARQSYSEWG